MTRHRYECPLRWADMDQLGHVNNVTYVDYLQEARVDMLRVHPPASGGEALAEGVVVVRHEVKYVAPLVYRPRPVSIELWVTEVRAASFTLAYEVFDDTEDGRRVYLRARSVLTPYVFDGEHPRRVTAGEREVLMRFLEPDPAPLRPALQLTAVADELRSRYRCVVRFSDVDAYRHVNNVKYFEYYQEARIELFTAMDAFFGGEREQREEREPSGVVVAQIDVDYRMPIFFREEPYIVETWVAQVGRSSFTLEARILDGDQELSRSRAVGVAFDAATQRAAPLSHRQRERLQSPRSR